MSNLKHLCDGVGSVWCFYLRAHPHVAPSCIVIGEIDSFERDRDTGKRLEEVYLKNVLLLRDFSGHSPLTIDYDDIQYGYFKDAASLPNHVKIHFFPNFTVLLENAFTYIHLTKPSDDEDNEEVIVDEPEADIDFNKEADE